MEVKEKELVKVIIDPNIEIVHEACPDCEAVSGREVVETVTQSG